jgi:hypothetical protein
MSCDPHQQYCKPSHPEQVPSRQVAQEMRAAGEGFRGSG